jgi:Ca-activated chloride channel family protein
MDVDTASYGITRRYLADGHLPEPDSVRVEEFVNSFTYHYPPPSAGQDFSLAVDAAPSPYNPRNDLVLIGIQARTVAAQDRQPASLTFVIDTSGSMAIESRLGTVKQALRLLVAELRADDTVGVVEFGTDARVVLPPTSGADKERILRAVDSLQTSGSTSIDAGLREGFKLAEQAFRPDGINRLLLCTDGVANNGVTSADALLAKYQAYLQKGMGLSAFGFGMGNYNDVLLEQLGDHGHGSYAYVDSLDEAHRVFVQDLTGTLQTIGRDAKVQVDFDPAVVSRYRLLGYENRALDSKDFRNDRAGGGEVGSGQSVTVLYEITRTTDVLPGTAATVRIRYRAPEGGQALEQAVQLPTSAFHASLEGASPQLRLASTAALFAEVLKHTYWAKQLSLQEVERAATQRLADVRDDQTTELLGLIHKAASLAPSPPDAR